MDVILLATEGLPDWHFFAGVGVGMLIVFIAACIAMLTEVPKIWHEGVAFGRNQPPEEPE